MNFLFENNFFFFFVLFLFDEDDASSHELINQLLDSHFFFYFLTMRLSNITSLSLFLILLLATLILNTVQRYHAHVVHKPRLPDERICVCTQKKFGRKKKKKGNGWGHTLLSFDNDLIYRVKKQKHVHVTYTQENVYTP